jgi:ketosteroid isomerase-like protein
MDRVSAPTEVAALVNACINGRHLDGLATLMSDDHTFRRQRRWHRFGQAPCLVAWQGFFAAYPHYRNVFTMMTVLGDVVMIVGYSVCADALLAGPAVWTATIDGDRVRIWQVSEAESPTADSPTSA